MIRKGTFTPPEIRLELYTLLNEVRAMQNNHVERWGREHVNKQDCPVCKGWEDEKDGIRRAIKRFGGTPRFGRW